MMIRKAASDGSVDPGRRERSRRTFPDRRCPRRRAPSGRRRAATARGIGLERGVKQRQLRACAAATTGVAPVLTAPTISSAMRAIELRLERRAQRAGRKHAAVADAAGAVDHQDREVLRKRRILESVVHHDDACALFPREPQRPRRGSPRRPSARRARAAAARRRPARRCAPASTDHAGRQAGRHSRG